MTKFSPFSSSDRKDTNTSILNTEAYHCIFNYTLNNTEIHKYLITHKFIQKESLDYLLNKYKESRPQTTINQTNANTSWKRITYAQNFWRKYSKLIPSIDMVAVSGSTAALNSTFKDDIDIFIITKPETSWLTRLICLGIVTLTNKRVQLNKDADNSNRFCLNLIIENKEESLLTQNQDLYTAMEIAHLKIIFDRNNTFRYFLKTNNWITSHLANFWQIASYEWSIDQINKQDTRKTTIAIQLANRIAKAIQTYNYKKKNKKELTLNQTWEVDYREKTMKEYQNRTKSKGVSEVT